MAGGANNTTYPNRERGLFANRPPKFLFGFWGAGGHYIPPPPRNANTVPAFPPFPHKRATPRHDPWRPRYPHLTNNAAAIACGGRAMRCATIAAQHGQRVRARPGPQVRPRKKRYNPQRLAIANKLYINARASAARFAHNVTAAGQQPRKAPAAAIGWAAGWPCAWRSGVRAIGAAVGPAPSGRGPWGTVRGAALRRACGNRRPMDGQQRPRWPRAAGMFQPGIMKTKFFLPMLSNDNILYHAGRWCRTIKKGWLDYENCKFTI